MTNLDFRVFIIAPNEELNTELVIRYKGIFKVRNFKQKPFNPLTLFWLELYITKGGQLILVTTFTLLKVLVLLTDFLQELLAALAISLIILSLVFKKLDKQFILAPLSIDYFYKSD